MKLRMYFFLWLMLSVSGTKTSFAQVTCDENRFLDESCSAGSPGRNRDDNRELPLKPSLIRDLHLLEVREYPRANIDTNVRENGYLTRPHIPPYRTTTDGRVAMQARTRSEGADDGVFHFYLFEPKRLTQSFLSSEVNEDDEHNGLEILSSSSPWFLNRSDFIDTDAQGSSMHSAICNDPAKPVRTCGANNNNDCYDFTVIAPFNNTDNDTMEIWGTEITVEVVNPKTADSRIQNIRTGTPRRGAVWRGVSRYLETMITADGRLMAGRVAGANIRYTGANGQRISGNYDSAYSAYPANLPACDPDYFESPLPISHMPYDDVVRQSWGVGRYPWRYPDGSIIADGAELRATYPWLDSQGKNIFFGTSNNHEPLHETGIYDVDCLDVIDERDCDLTRAAESSNSTRALTVVGLWTQGRAVLMDNMLNNIDWGLGANPTEQRVAKLYHEDDGWVRVGSGSLNVGDLFKTNIPGSSGNINFIDSIESKFNHDENLKLNVPADVAWLISNGTATDVVSFDDWVNPYALIASSMVQAKTGEDFTADFERVQNSASGRFNTPSHGQVIGAGSVERVALGGVRGKGLFLRPSSGLQYQIPDGQQHGFDNESWYLGFFIDPRNQNDNYQRRIIEFPNGSAIDLQGLHSLSFVAENGDRIRGTQLRTALPFAEFSHVGFRISSDSRTIEVFVNGMQVAAWRNISQNRPIASGELTIGMNSNVTDPRFGFHGWIDEVKLFANADVMNAEEICNKAMGSIVNLSPRSSFHSAARADYPAWAHNDISSVTDSEHNTFRCHTDFENNDGWVDLNNLPSNMTSVRNQLIFPEGPLVFNQQRPDSTDNGFCLSCHAADFTNIRPESLRRPSLEANGIWMQDDTRRQPSQPPARVHGIIPARTFGDYPLNDVRNNNEDGRPIDRYISR